MTEFSPVSGASARTATVERRRAIEAGLVAEWSLRACSRLIRTLSAEGQTLAGETVALYRSLPGEPALAELESFFVAQGARLAYPRVVDRTTGAMAMVLVANPAAETWQKGTYGMDEPSSQGSPLSPDQIDLFVIPGAAFGPQGERVGMGAGFYDRYLRSAPRALRVAVAFEYQVYSSLAQAEWDQPVDWLITEDRVIRTQARTGVPQR